jgi:glycosyltransferase involved in cell wall biosynthesis
MINIEKINKKIGKVVAVIPAYNEESTIGKIIKETKKYVDDIIVVDDGSRDKTRDIALKEGVKVVSHTHNMGLGAALRHGFRVAIKMDADVIITLDADGQHVPSDIPKLLKKIEEGYDFVLGERDLKKYPLVKKIGNFILNFLTNLISGTTLHDTESGFRAIRKEALKKMYPYLKGRGYEIACEMIFAVGYYNLKYTNVRIKSPVYVKGVTIRDGIRNFMYMIRKRKRNLRSYIQDFKYVTKKWLKRWL